MIQLCSSIPVMWSETVGLRTRPVCDQKIGLGLGLVGLVLCCELVRHHNDLEGQRNFSSTIYSFTILCLEHHIQWRSMVAFTYLKVKYTKWFTSGGLGLGLVTLVVVLVLVILVLILVLV